MSDAGSPEAIRDDAVAVRLTIDTLGFSVVLGLQNRAAYDLAAELIFGRISRARLPPLTHDVIEPTSPPVLFIDIAPSGDRQLDVQFRGAIESPRYVAERTGFHWDFSKVLNALVMSRMLGTGLVPLHGACVETPRGATLLTGASGAGKSSVSYAALSSGRQVYASELGFFRSGVLECGNSALTIDRAAIARFQLADPSSNDAEQGEKLSFDLSPQPPVAISRVCFIQVNDGPVRVRTITERRARMLLFENLVTQLPVTQLLSQETWPLWLPPSKKDVDRAMGTIQTLADLMPSVVEGHPARIVDFLCEAARDQ